MGKVEQHEGGAEGLEEEVKRELGEGIKEGREEECVCVWGWGGM